ncbi:MAG: DinB family protein [Chitinophagaceae bacterium]
MKKFITIPVLFMVCFSFCQTKTTPTLKSILLEQLKSTHNVKDWFVPVNIALEDLTPEQAMWKDSSGNHSVAQLANHLIFWNLEQLDKFKGLPTAPFDGNNDKTFSNLDKASWAATVKRADSVLTAWEKAIETADEKKLNSWYNTIAHINTHNAYHVGQIIFVRKEQGSWNPEKGVK